MFDPQFIYDSYSCRLEKGTHRAVKRLADFTRKVSKNFTRECFVLHLDINKFFASVDHSILLSILQKKIGDPEIIWLLSEVINSFRKKGFASGIPLGNLTSQIFANIYLNELDQFIKHMLKAKYYIRYADDFVIVSDNIEFLYRFIDTSKQFLSDKLRLTLHEKKIVIRKFSWGIDFLGYIVLPHYILPRTKTKRRLIKKLKEKIDSPTFNQSLQSYLGYLSHANAFKFVQQIAIAFSYPKLYK